MSSLQWILVFLMSFGIVQNVDVSNHLWQPSDGRSRDEWLDCHGQPAEVCQRIRTKLAQLIRWRSGGDAVGTPAVTASKSSKDASNGAVQGCILLTEEQVDEMILEVDSETLSSAAQQLHRRKRQLLNFTTGTTTGNKWTSPITYKFDGTHNETEMSAVRSAFQQWMDNTCVRFNEISTGAAFTDHHIIFTKPLSGCNSYVGVASVIPQPLNLAENCFTALGVVIHEIGHALGLYHEQQRKDRDSYVEVFVSNIDPGSFDANYRIKPTVDVGPYTYSSVMHYGVKDFAVNRSNDVMRPLNPLYQLSLGQQVELSFSDIHAINVAYCNTTCSSYPPLNCQRRGYRHPNNCSRCACPDGFGGLTCERVADPVNAVCGGTFNLSDTDQLTIKSPGYDSPGYYLSYQECSWLITVPRGYYVQLQFVGVFYIFGNTYRCAWHWVEVKYKSDLGLDGPRFCWTAHSDVLTSESNEMLVIFKSNFLQTSRIRGFQANITVVAMPSTNTVSTLPSATSTLLTTTNNPESTSAGVNHSASVTSTLAAGRITTHRSTANSMHVTCLLHILAASAAIVFTAKIYLL